jgi:hypothetical protein
MTKNEEPITFGKKGNRKGSRQLKLPHALPAHILPGIRPKQAGLGILAVALAAGLVFAGLWMFRGWQQDRVNGAMQAGAKLAEDARPEGVADEAQAQAWKGDVDGADSKLQTAIAAAPSNEEKHRLLVQRAVIALNSNQQQRALDSIAEAEKYGTSKASSDTGALAAEEAKNRPLAILYYTKSLERLDKSDPLYQQEMQNIQEKIEELQQ